VTHHNLSHNGGGSFVSQQTAAKDPGRTAAPPVLSPESAVPSAEPQPSPAVAQGPLGRAQGTCCKRFRGRGTTRGGLVHPPRARHALATNSVRTSVKALADPRAGEGRRRFVVRQGFVLPHKPPRL
jgi:hypothetical protein